MVNDKLDADQRLELIALRRKKKLLQNEKELRRKNGLAFYKPHPKQDVFHRAGKHRRRYCRTGNRFGKSDMGAAEDCAFALGERIWYPKDDPARYEGIPKHPTKGLIIVTDWDKAEEIFTSLEEGDRKGKLFRFLPHSRIKKIDKNHSGNICRIVVESIHGGDSVIYLDTVASYKNNKMGSESSDWDWIHVDEPIPKGMWKAVARGLVDRRGSAWFTCTPVTEMWINDMFIPPSRTRDTFDVPFVNAQDRWVVTGSMRDNPYLTEAAIQDYIDDLDDDEKECRINGIPSALLGVIYKQFSPELHIYRGTPHGWEAPDKPPKDYTIRYAIDPHPKVPHAVLFTATSPLGVTYVYKELFLKTTIGDLSIGINDILEGYDPYQSLCDPIAFLENPEDKSTWADTFFANGLLVEKATKELAHGILKTQEKLREKTSDGSLAIRFSEDLQETLYEFDRYVWNPDDEKPEKNCPDHMMENLYRLVLTGLSYEDNVVEYVVPAPMDFTTADLSFEQTRKEMMSFSTSPSRQRVFNRANRYPC